MLNNRWCLISGASRGIGEAIARNFAKNGANLILVSRDIEALEAIKESITDTEVAVFKADISKSENVKELFLKIRKQTKSLDVVINCAGVLESALISMTTDSQIHRLFENNVFSQFYMLRYASRMMIKSPYASIVNISSIMGIEGGRATSLYSATKASIIGFSRSLAKELAPDIRVNVIAPGVVDTALIADLQQDSRDDFISDTLLKRVASADEIANVALFLASDMSSFITGEIIRVDGGLCLR